MDLEQFSKIFDHTNLHADATAEDIENLCEEALEYGFGAVCINAGNIPLAKEILKDSEVEICTVIGFPLGATLPAAKAYEVEQARKAGASEFDMVINIGALKSGDYDTVEKDIQGVIKAANGDITKVILETCYLTDKEIKKACELALKANADFVKTSTGFGPEGATLEHVSLMKKIVGDRMKVKASGGIRSYEKAKKMLDAGAERIGASSSVTIVEEYRNLLAS
ncbi:MAG: deoxyribose-phosphate aldolase [Promethearchaeia archaeon]